MSNPLAFLRRPDLRCACLFPLRIIRVTDRVVLKRPIESTAIIRRKWQSFLQPLWQIWVANEVPAVQQRIILPGLEHTPGVRVIKTASGEERCAAKDVAEGSEVDRAEAPGIEELLLFGFAVDLLIALGSLSVLLLD